VLARWFLLLSFGWTGAFAQAVWFTVAGDPDNEAVNTVQVNPVSVESGPGLRTMKVRVSRSAPRTSWDGVPYRSYVSAVLFDCPKGTARYLTLTFYMQPGWKGEPHRTVDYGDPPRWMEFRDVTPNPNERIRRAACGGNLPPARRSVMPSP
jgi:hypothetical protein